ncbi:MAG: heavy-metal-associated domain-containing protein [Saprospiraceae bacterium]|jgi:copper chaperone CopZ|nr:heavy-metal-associated domain-containing protein [Saprospiraceae bacterium]
MKHFLFILLLACSQNASLGTSSCSSTFIEIAYQNNIRSVEIIVGGMSCQKGCADGIDKKLKTVSGILKSKTKLETGICKVTYDDQKIKLQAILDIIVEKGYTAKLKI